MRMARRTPDSEHTAQDYGPLVRAARAARRRAYAPYSHFPVGAAVLASDGSVYAGGNVENASYGLTQCAERVAVQSAIAAGRRRLRAVAIAGAGGITPCGACRQVMAEFGVRTVILARPSGAPTVVALAELLPQPFSPAVLRAAGRRRIRQTSAPRGRRRRPSDSRAGL
jgi:cytidine deaminase